MLRTLLTAVDTSNMSNWRGSAGASATFRFSGEREPVDAFVEAEQRCCAFFEFDVRRDGELVRLEVGAPAGAEPFVRALVAAVVGGWEAALG